MTDVVDAKTRSGMMSKIRGFGNRSTELAFVALMKEAKITGWRRHLEFRMVLRMPSKSEERGIWRKSVVRPDFTFYKQRLVVFIDGCFWHQCPKHSSIPDQNAKYWKAKLGMNVARDKATVSAFSKKGWMVMRVWEHELAQGPVVMRRLARRLTQKSH